jgi:2-oxoglutarate dehydrogenase E2 component (dihydrolipoamide succinyltransferase)
MAVTLDQLGAAVHSFFTRKLSGAVGDSPGNVLLVLDGFGSPLPPGEFGAGATESQQQLLAHQRAAQLADQLPAANGLGNGWYLPRSGSRLSFWYKALLAGSVCTSGTAQAVAAFESRKASALKRLAENELLEIAGVTGAGGTVNPTGVSDANFATGMSPTNWFLPDTDSWETLRIDGTEPVPPVPSPVPVPNFDAQVLVPMPEPPDPGQFFPGRVDFVRTTGETVTAGDLFARQFFHPRKAFGDSIDIDIFTPATGTVLDRVSSADDLEPGDQIATIGVRRTPVAASERNAVVMPSIDKPLFFAKVHQWHKGVGDAVTADEPLVDIHFQAPVTDDEFDLVVQSPVSGTVLEINRPAGEMVGPDMQLAVVGEAPRPPEGFTVEFEYTIVNFSRPWWDEVFLSAGNWMVPGFGRGAAASGNIPNVAASAITLITSGMVVVRNLHITSRWDEGERDQLASGALNLGPFSLTGADVDSETLARPGAQAMGWICQVPPVLPPVGDPDLPPT